MSTKASLLHGKDYHLYEDFAKKGWIFLEINNEEIKLPLKLQQELFYVFSVYESWKSMQRSDIELRKLDEQE